MVRDVLIFAYLWFEKCHFTHLRLARLCNYYPPQCYHLEISKKHNKLLKNTYLRIKIISFLFLECFVRNKYLRLHEHKIKYYFEQHVIFHLNVTKTKLKDPSSSLKATTAAQSCARQRHMRAGFGTASPRTPLTIAEATTVRCIPSNRLNMIRFIEEPLSSG